MFRFASPYFLILMALIPATLWYGRRRFHIPAMANSGLGPAAGMPSSLLLGLGKRINVMFYLGLVLMIAALARPQWGTQKTTIDTTGINMVLAVDLSESMAALDFSLQGKNVNRLEAVKTVVKDFISKRAGDRIGLVVFGSQAYTQVPLTLDYGTIRQMMERLQIGAAGQATAIGDAIGIALKRLEDIESRSNVIILLTDGRSNTGEFEPLTTAAIAREKGVKIYTIGVGSKGRVPFPVKDSIFGQRLVKRRFDMDAKTLQEIADQTGGLFFKASDLAGLEKIYDTIDAMEKSEVKVDTFAEYRELYNYLLLPAFALLGLWVMLKNTRFLRIP
jgi:Ca-activated chloride channel family protein